MEPVQAQSMTRRRAVLAMAALPFALTGCVLMPKKKDISPAAAEAPKTNGRKLIATFSKQVSLAGDPLKGGQPNPGLVGKVYIIAENQGNPLTGDGTLVVDLFDHTPRLGQNEPKMLEEWRFDAETLSKFIKPDIVGKNYTLFLPWATYNADVTQVLLQFRYDGKDGTSLFTQSGVLTLDHAVVKETSEKSRKVGG